MREGWEYKKLGEIINVRTGKLDANASSEDGQYPFFTCSREPLRISSYSYDCECVLVAGNGDLNVKYYNGKFDAYQRTYIITLKEGITKTSVPFLYKFFTSYIEVLRQRSIGGIIKYIKLGDITNAILPLPPLSMQETIVSELDKINELIRLKKEQLKDYDNLAQSIFYEMFGDPVVNEKGWEVKKLGEVAMIKTGPFGSMLHKEDYITGGIPLINPMHIQNFKAVPDQDFTISKEKAAELCNYHLKINDVIFARRGDIGRCAVISDKEEGYLCGTGSLFVRFERKLSSIYTMYVVRTTSFIKELVSKAKGATMLNLNSSTMENLRFPIPPLPLQQAFAKRIELIEQQKAEIQSTIADLETLLASRMQYWFD